MPIKVTKEILKKLCDQGAITVAEAKAYKLPSKMKNKRKEIDGHKFPSIAEANRYGELKLLQKGGLIANLKLQPLFRICLEYPEPSIGPVFITSYRADFRYEEKFGEHTFNTVVEDVKGQKSGLPYEMFLIKKRLMKCCHNIDVVEIC